MLKMFQNFITPGKAAEIEEVRQNVKQARIEIIKKLDEEGKSSRQLARALLEVMSDAKHS